MMNAAENEKVWFVKIGNSTEGPFSIEELKQKVLAGELFPQQEARANGTSNWVAISTLFSNTQFTNTSTLRTQGGKSKDELSAFIVLNPDVQDQTSLIDRKVLKKAHNEAEKVKKIAENEREKVMSKVLPPPRSKLPFIFFGLLAVVGGAVYMYMKLASPIPNLADVSEQDLLEMKKVSKISYKNDGPKVTVAISNSSSLKPKFYIATNFADNTSFEILLRPMAETLLQKPFDPITQKVTVKNALANTTEFTYKNSDLPIGEYQLEVKPSDSANAIFNKRFFLGGTKDATYDQKLESYHKEMKTAVLANLKNSKELIDSFEQMYLFRVQSFLAGMKLLKQPKVLTRFWNTTSTKARSQFQIVYGKYNALKPIATDKSSADIVRDLDMLFQSMIKLSTMQSSYFLDKGANRVALDGQIKSTNDFIMGKLQEVKEKQSITEKEVERSDGYMEGASK